MIPKTLKDGTTVQTYPMSIPQQLMFFMSLQYGVGYPINNIGSGYYWQEDFDFDIMKESVQEAVIRCDTMRLRFLQDETYKLVQYVNEVSEMEIETWDFSNMPIEAAHEKLLAIARGPIPMFDCELHKIALVRLADGYNGIFMKLQHLAMDAYSAKVFTNDILDIYYHKTTGAAYPKPMRPYIPVLLTELAYTKSEQYQIDRKYWFDSLAKSTEPIFTDYMLNSRLKEQQKEHPEHRFADIHSGSPEAGLITFDMSAEDSAKIMKMCEETGFSVCAALSMGIRSALSVFNDNEQDVSFKMIVNRRATISEKKSGGLRINFFPMRSIISPDSSFKDAILEISRIQNEMYEHCSLSFMEMLMLRHESMPEDAKPDSTYDSVGFSYQPLLKNSTKKVDIYNPRSIWYNNGATMIPLYLTVRHRAEDEGFTFVFEYRKQPDPQKDLTVFYKKIHGVLMIGAENPDVSVAEILKKNAVKEEERR